MENETFHDPSDLGLPTQARPCCPRCGYDLAGLPASWTNSCPLSGSCSECGLSFQWADVLSTRRTPPAWSFEHTRSRLLPRAVRTWVGTFFPFAFWSGLRLEHPVRPWRLAMFLVAHLVMGHAVLAGLAAWNLHTRVGSFAWFTDLIDGTMSYHAQEALLALLLPAYHIATKTAYSPYVLCVSAGVLTWAVLCPAGYLLLGDTFARAKVRFRHLFRAGVYGFSLPLQIIVLWLGVRIVHYMLQWGGGRVMGVTPATLVAWLASATFWAPYVMLAWVPWWWWNVTHRYLRLDQPRLVTILMLVMAGLASAIAVVLAYIWDNRR